MGKKTKIGKQRKDKYYQLAKETGYRSRASFKLIQLNRKFDFLQRSQVLVDLCAAPGGWLQVATENMPVSSLIIGVDLVSIKSLPNVITLQDDITKDSCKRAIQKELKTWLADCVLHDGAPNVGKTWIHDAFMQAQLTLSALKLATSILRKGGWFVTKIFRSKDHPALLETFGKLFKKVFVTKPQASRNESAEIFVICQSYLKPEKLDERLLDPNSVFKDVVLESSKHRLNLIHPEKTKKKAEGYAEGQLTLYNRLLASEFILGENIVDRLSEATEIVIDDERVLQHEATTAEIRNCCKDIKVLGRKELRDLLAWRRNMKQYLLSLAKAAESTDATATPVDNEDADDQSDDEEKKMDDEVMRAKEEEKKEAKKKRRKEMKEKRRYRDKVELKMIHPGDQPDISHDVELFDISSIHSRKQLDVVVDAPLPEPQLNDEEALQKLVSIRQRRSSDDVDDEGDALPGYAQGEILEMSDLSDNDDAEDSADAQSDDEPAGLVVDLDDADKATKQARTVQTWFKKDIFAGLEDDDDDMEPETSSSLQKQQSSDQKGARQRASGAFKAEVNDDELSESGVESMEDDEDDDEPTAMGDDLDAASSAARAMKPKKAKKIMLDPESLALGELLMHSSKSKRDLIEMGYNRYTNNDEGLPDWFVLDEKKHYKKQLPVTKEQMAFYEARLKEIDARPIKKVLEAKARKRKRTLRRMEKAKKRAEHVVENGEMTEREKGKELRKIYKQAAPKRNTDVTYVVAKKGQVGRRVGRPSGVSGRFKVVDPRLKKDQRNKNAQQKKKGRAGAAAAKGKRGGRAGGGQRSTFKKGKGAASSGRKRKR